MKRLLLLVIACESSKNHPNVVEGEYHLHRLERAAKVAFITNGEFPKGKASELPAHSCCERPEHKCAVTDAWVHDPVWAALEFHIDEATFYQYTYESDGKSFHATATVDPYCDGHPMMYRLEGSSATHEPVVTLSKPGS